MASDDAVLVLDNADDVAVARRKLLPGEILSVGDARIPVLDVIPLGHKIALHDVAEADPVTKYGYQIGVALQPIKAGQHVHVHNLVFSSHHKPKASDLDHHAWTPPATPSTAANTETPSLTTTSSLAPLAVVIFRFGRNPV